MNIRKMFLTWEKVEKLVSLVVGQLQRSQANYDYIFGIGTGGYIPLAMIAKRMEWKQTRVVNARSFSKKDERGKVEVEYFPNDMELAGKTILVVDDIVASGATMSHVKRIFTNRGAARVITASLVVSRRVCPLEAYPDLFGEAILRGEDEMIFFPWDQ
jgi:hypoxanthine phosphoribosyltransferase